jgi:hypothetical protein
VGKSHVNRTKLVPLSMSPISYGKADANFVKKQHSISMTQQRNAGTEQPVALCLTLATPACIEQAAGSFKSLTSASRALTT